MFEYQIRRSPRIIIRAMVLVCAMSLLGSSGMAEAWDCIYLDEAKATKHAKVNIYGDKLDWQVKVVVPRPEPKLSTATFQYRVLENNDVGLVAVWSQSKINQYVGSLVSAEVLVINKKDGKFHVGDVGLKDIRDSMSGECHIR